MPSNPPPPLPNRATKPAPTTIKAIDNAFALTATEPVAERDTGNVGFSTWEEQHVEIDEEIAQLRRAHLQKYVKATMAGSVAILVVAMIRAAMGGAGQEEATARATFAKMREIPAEIAALPKQLSTLSARTQAALKVERHRETMKQTTASRAKSFW
jgi:hypothetical protein